MGREITLIFNVDNNFDPICEKFGTSGEDIEIIKTVSWLINCSESAINDAYGKNSPRQIEMTKLSNNLREQLRKQISIEEAGIIKL
jgi:hypothetical protein